MSCCSVIRSILRRKKCARAEALFFRAKLKRINIAIRHVYYTTVRCVFLWYDCSYSTSYVTGTGESYDSLGAFDVTMKGTGTMDKPQQNTTMRVILGISIWQPVEYGHYNQLHMGSADYFDTGLYFDHHCNRVRSLLSWYLFTLVTETHLIGNS